MIIKNPTVNFDLVINERFNLITKNSITFVIKMDQWGLINVKN